MSRLMFRRTTQTGNLLYGKKSPDSNGCFVIKIYPLNSIEQPIETLQEEPIVFVPIALESDSYLIPEEESLGYINSVKGHDEKQMIYDSFIEGRKDTL